MKAVAKPARKRARKPEPETRDVAQSIKQASALWGIPKATMLIAKNAGCRAFVQHRVHREPLLKWLVENPEASAEGDSKTSEAELKRKKLQNEVTLGELKIANENKKIIAREEAKAEWARALAIIQEEAKLLMEKDHYRVFIERTKAKIGELHEA